MKKIFMLLFSVTMVASAFAQYDREDRKDYGKGNDVSYNDGRYRKEKDRYSVNKRERQIAQINYGYDQKIQSVKNRLFMSRAKKERMICALEDQRKAEIRQVYGNFKDSRDRHHDDDHDHGRDW